MSHTTYGTVGTEYPYRYRIATLTTVGWLLWLSIALCSGKLDPWQSTRYRTRSRNVTVQLRMLRAAKNLHYFSAPRYPYLLVARCVWQKKNTTEKPIPTRSVSNFFFNFECLSPLFLSVNRTSSIRFAWWVHISGSNITTGNDRPQNLPGSKCLCFKK